VTDTTPASIPPDPAKYDEERNVHARRRGLQQPYITGGDDPDLEEAIREERPYVRILVGMVVAIIVLGFVLGFLGAMLGTPPA
jgi:hypothetical protein